MTALLFAAASALEDPEFDPAFDPEVDPELDTELDPAAAGATLPALACTGAADTAGLAATCCDATARLPESTNAALAADPPVEVEPELSPEFPAVFADDDNVVASAALMVVLVTISGETVAAGVVLLAVALLKNLKDDCDRGTPEALADPDKLKGRAATSAEPAAFRPALA